MRTNLKLAFLMTTGLALGGVAAAQGNAEESDDMGCPMRAEMRQKMLDRFDANKDGKLDAQERSKMHDQLKTERFKQLDANGDGQISQAEFMAARPFRGWQGQSTQGEQAQEPQPSPPQPAPQPPSQEPPTSVPPPSTPQ